MPKTKPLKTTRTEAQVLAQIIDAAAMLGVILDRQNTGAGVNPCGKMVRFGVPGNSDLSGILPDGRRLDCEVKHEDYRPPKYGKAREHFDRQLARLRRTNESGGVGFWVDNVDAFIRVIRHCMEGCAVEEGEDGRLYLIRGRKDCA